MMKAKPILVWLVYFALMVLIQGLIWQTFTQGEFLTRPMQELVFFFFNMLWIPLFTTLRFRAYQPWFRWVGISIRGGDTSSLAEAGLVRPYKGMIVFAVILGIALAVAQAEWVYADKPIVARLVLSLFGFVGGFTLAWELTRLVWPRVQSPLEKMG